MLPFLSVPAPDSDAGRRLAAAPAVGLAVVLAAAAPALARCPETPADAAAGIIVTFQDGSESRVTVADDGITREEMSYNDGTGQGERTQSRHGYLLQEMHATENGSIMAGQSMLREWPAEILAAPPQAPGTSLDLETTETVDGESFAMAVRIEADIDRPQLVGGCPLTTRQITMTLDPGGVDALDTYLFFPDLGTGFYTGSSGGGMEPLELRPMRLRVAE